MTDERRDERIDRIVSEAVRREYGEADTPREAMWAALEADRAAARPPSRSRLRRVAALAVAAVVTAIVFGISRVAEEPPVEGVAPTVEAPEVGPDDLLLRGHFARAGTLLDTVETGETPDPADAAPLLATTRLLLDDPALDAPTARLLADAEVALALLVRSGGAEASIERVVLRETVADGRLATRLLAASGRAP